MTGDWETRRHQTLVSSFRAKREIFVIRGQGLTLSPHVPRTSSLYSSVFHTASALSAPTGHLPLEGKADGTLISSFRAQARNLPCRPINDACVKAGTGDWETSASLVSSFRAKREIFIVLRESACMHRGKMMSWYCLTSGDERFAIKISRLRSK